MTWTPIIPPRVSISAPETQASFVTDVPENPLSFGFRVNDDLARTRYGVRLQLKIEDGCVVVMSDQHYDVGAVSAAHKLSLDLIERLRPFGLITNGDALDFPGISRWPAHSYSDLSSRPSVGAELQETAYRLSEYEQFDFVKYRTWNLGNHDARYELRLAERVPEFVGVSGFTLAERFPGWALALRTDFMNQRNEIELLSIHAFKGGVHAGYNNALGAGTSVVTGHDHMLKATPSVDANLKTRWGIQAGTMAPVDSPRFLYTGDRPTNWNSGFVVLHFRDDRFIGPELVYVNPDGTALFRGEVLRAK